MKSRGGGASFLYSKKTNYYFVNFVRPNGKFVQNTPTGGLWEELLEQDSGDQPSSKQATFFATNSSNRCFELEEEDPSYPPPYWCKLGRSSKSEPWFGSGSGSGLGDDSSEEDETEDSELEGPIEIESTVTSEKWARYSFYLALSFTIQIL